jgi:CBS domain containing-hemolysin-like protein
MVWFLVALFATLGISFLCSLMEAVMLGTTVGEIETLKKERPKHGERLEQLRLNLNETVLAILAVNTTATTLCSVMVGGLAIRHFGETVLGLLACALTFTVLIFSEVLPKNLALAHRRALQPLIVFPQPVIYVCDFIVRIFVKAPKPEEKSGEEIILLAERGAQEGTLTHSESNIIANALSLDEVRVSEIMTPRTVVTALRKSATVAEIFREYPNIPFARMPVYGKNIDDVAGIVRRRDLLKAKANDQDYDLVEKFMQEVQFIPETVTVANALQVFLQTHQQILVVVDEFGSTAGVVSMEDVMEQLLGREIFEKDDVAVDMRELARAKKLQRQSKARRGSSGTTPPTPL